MTLGLSVVVPMFNEEEVVPLFVQRLRPELDALSHDGVSVTYEVVCVDDGSRDGTAELLFAAREEWPQLRLVRLLRNAGHQAALTAGLDSARAEYAVTIDADLQDPPEAIGQMYSMAVSDGLDVVYGVRSDRSSDTMVKRWTAHSYYRVMRRLSGPQLPDNAGDFRLVSRRVIHALSALPEHGRVYRLVIPWFGFPSGQVTYVRDRRAAGRTKYPLSRMVSLGLDSVTAFSAVPLRFATWAGMLGTGFALFAMGWALWGSFVGGTVPGWTSTVATLGLLAAVQLLCLGLLGEYVARIFVASQGRPTYLVGYDSLHHPHPALRHEVTGSPTYAPRYSGGAGPSRNDRSGSAA
ncbi:glycosyltransferase family 2 protein [Nocardioides mesophilus]|uniref:Glycosyltransferase family 2 protein n=1 Tax=Nocardioides mesophilus TaxID=433659 RepID=A0A7G9RC44_9ACTN|nr:glycosyltransferase family 2 protein [Nocardioides mesophilus]QNN53169.1 glycosyltransferase family 2 protein [Nocardioides mesophilus]